MHTFMGDIRSQLLQARVPMHAEVLAVLAVSEHADEKAVAQNKGYAADFKRTFADPCTRSISKSACAFRLQFQV